jgi:hypothetical protein
VEPRRPLYQSSTPARTVPFRPKVRRPSPRAANEQIVASPMTRRTSSGSSLMPQFFRAASPHSHPPTRHRRQTTPRLRRPTCRKCRTRSGCTRSRLCGRSAAPRRVERLHHARAAIAARRPAPRAACRPHASAVTRAARVLTVRVHYAGLHARTAQVSCGHEPLERRARHARQAPYACGRER